MATFLYVGDEPRMFPSAAVQAGRGPFEPGEHIETDENPDPRWFDEVTSPDGVRRVDVSAQVSEED